MKTPTLATLVASLVAAPILLASDNDAPLPTYVPASLFWGDFDGDGLDDAWAVQPDGTGHLMHNDGRGGFNDVTERVGLAGVSGAHMALFADVDGDERSDLYLPAWRGASRLFRQIDGGTFEDVTRTAGLPVHAEPVQARLRDLDGDGRLDLHLVTLHDDLLYRNLGRMQFEKVDLGLAPRTLPKTDSLAAARLALGLPGNADAGQNGWVTFGSGPGTTSSQIICARTLQDQAFPADCLMASSAPTMGMLFPISSDFYIDAATGYVGINNTSPGVRLEVMGAIRGGQLRSTTTTNPPMQVASSMVVTNLNADQLDGFDASAFSMLGNSIGTGEIQDGAVTNSKLASSAVDSSKILNGSIVDADVSASAAIQGTKIAPAFGNQNVTAIGNADFTGFGGSTVRAVSVNGPTSGHVGVQGTTDFEGVLSADWIGYELGVVGLSTGGSVSDNFGVMGHSNHAGVRGEHSGDPLDDWGHLGMENYGVVANGDTAGVSATNSFGSLSLGRLGTISFGVYGEGNSAGGRFGNTANSTILDGGRGETSNSSGYGIWGRNSSTFGGVARGVYGQTSSSSSFGVYASGGMGGTGAKYFINPHPTNPLKEVRMVCLEGDESGTYFRGTSTFENGVAIIDVPEVFRLASIEERMTVQLTAVGAPALTWVESQGLDEIVVRSNADVEFHYFVNGVRRGYEDIELIVDNQSYVPSPEDLGKPYGTQYPDSYRQMLVENGILNPDFTPNEATIALMEAALEFYAVRNADVRAVQAAEELAQADAREAVANRAASTFDQ